MTNTPLTITRSRRRIVLRLVQGLLVTAVGFWRLWMEGWVPRGESEQMLLICLAWVLAIGGLWIIAWSLQSLRRVMRPVMTFDANGVTIDRPSIGMIPWSAVGSVRPQRIRSRQYLHINLLDPQVVERVHARAPGSIVEREVWFEVSDLDMSAAELADMLERGRSGRELTDPVG